MLSRLAVAIILFAQVASNPIPPRDTTPGPQQLAWVDRSGRVIDSVGELLQVISDVAISSDASRIAVRGRQDGNDDIWVYDASTERRTQVTTDAAAERHPAWTPAGDRLAYTSYRGSDADLLMRGPDGSGSETTLLDGPGFQEAHAWSANGRYVIVQQRAAPSDPRIDLAYVEMNADRTLHPFVTDASAAALPRFAPDGRHVAYMSNGSGRWEVYVKPFPDGDAIQVSKDGGAWPRWNGAGDELFFFVDDALAVVSVSTRDTLRFGSPETLFIASHVAMNPASLGTLDPTYDVAPDGQRFIVVQQLAGAHP
jgi:serine/threonine-protein kinase